MNSVDFRVQREAYLLVSLGRGGRGDDSCGGGVVNGGLWWPEEASEVAVCCWFEFVAAACALAGAGEEAGVVGKFTVMTRVVMGE